MKQFKEDENVPFSHQVSVISYFPPVMKQFKEDENVPFSQLTGHASGLVSGSVCAVHIKDDLPDQGARLHGLKAFSPLFDRQDPVDSGRNAAFFGQG